MKNMKTPNLKCRYSIGLGDLIACSLHSKLLGWFTHFLTGKKEPCVACSERAYVLNVLFPIPVWKLFFKSLDDRNNAIINDFKKLGYIVETENDKQTFIASKIEEVKNEKIANEEKNNLINDGKNEIDFKKYQLISSNDTEIENHLLRFEIYKKI